MQRFQRVAQMSRQSMYLFSRPVSLARFSSASADDSYHSLDDQVFYTPTNSVEFTGETYTVFDGDEVKERRFVPFELKELAFKYSLISGLFWTTNYMYMISPWLDLAASGAVLNCLYSMYSIMGVSVSRVALHRDGKQVTLTPRIGSPITVKIKDIRKLREERDLVQTYEESYLFPIEVSGKKMYLHGQGQESIKHGEVFRAVLNGQSIKL